METLPEIETERLLLRTLVPADAPALFGYAVDPRVSRFLLWSPHKDIEESRAAIDRFREAPQMMQWAITQKDGGVLVGVGGFGVVNGALRSADLGYSFSPAFWGQGFATEMTKAVISHGFLEMGLFRIQGAIHPENAASGRVLEKSGLTYEATLRSWMVIDGQPIDTMIYAITSADFETRQTSNSAKSAGKACR